MRIQWITSNPNKMRSVNNGGRLIYTEVKGNPPNPSHDPKTTFF